MRAVKEWKGRTPDTPAPDRVKMRVLEAYNRRCHWSGRRIRSGDAWDVDHIIAIANGGENRERNLAPILRGKPHKEKTKQDMALKKRTTKIRKRDMGLRKPKHIMPGSRKSKWKKPLGGGPAVLREAGR